jgi:putative ABC transport system ATP-binding protein
VDNVKRVSDTAPLVEIRHLVKSYRRGVQTVPVLSDITLSIGEGDFIALMGPSGSGKSTLLNLIAGIDRPDGGELRVGGLDITRLSESALAEWRAAHVGFIFQFYNLMPVLTAFENIELPLILTRLSRKERRERVSLVLDMVNLSDRAQHYPSELSGGQQQRVEPTGDLDRTSAEEVLTMMQRLNRELGKTIIMVTHDAHAAGAAKALVHLEKGELIDGTTR